MTTRAKGQSVHLGFEIETGTPVEIPVRHMIITGQTQEAGKTTTLEALIQRSELRAIAFLTKRGEGAFQDAPTIAPYFREQADWQYVASILEASRGEKLKFERAWIIRASRGARTLAEVQLNVQIAMRTAKGLSADVYLTLDAYLEVVVPQIARTRWATRVELGAGMHVMDLTSLAEEMQHLVIKSTLDWVLEHAERNTIVVVPEAWKFIPQGRNTPVKRSAEAFIRQTAGLGTYLWLDSQDIAGVEKLILKSVPVWVLGVQREANEIKRTLDNIPKGIKKPTAEAIATLGLGEFYACWGTHALKTYVQPAWLEDTLAQQTALGYATVTPAIARNRKRQSPLPVEESVNKAEAERLERDNDRLTRENEDLRRRLEASESKPSAPAPTNNHKNARAAADAFDAGAPILDPLSVNTDGLYRVFKERLLKEAKTDLTLLKVLVSRPSIELEVTREIIHVDGKTLRGRIARLIADGFWSTARTSADALEEMLKRGADRPSNIELGNAMKALTEMGFFTRENKWYTLADGAEVNVKERTR